MTDSQKLDYLIEQLAQVKGETFEIKRNIRDLQVQMNKQENEIGYMRTFHENNLEEAIKNIAEGKFA